MFRARDRITWPERYDWACDVLPPGPLCQGLLFPAPSRKTLVMLSVKTLIGRPLIGEYELAKLINWCSNCLDVLLILRPWETRNSTWRTPCKWRARTGIIGSPHSYCPGNHPDRDVTKEPGWLALKLISSHQVLSNLKSVDHGSTGVRRDANSSAVLISVSDNSAPRCLGQVLNLDRVVHRRMSGFSLTLHN